MAPEEHPRWVRRIQRAALVVSQAGLAIALVAVVAVALISTADAIGGRLFNRPVLGAVEIATAALPPLTFLTLGYLQVSGRGIRMEVLYANISVRWQRLLDILNNVVVGAFVVLLTVRTYDYAMASWQVGETASGATQFAIYPFKFGLPLGMCVLLVVLAAQVVIYGYELKHPETADEQDEPDPRAAAL